MHAIIAVARADFLERIRRRSFLVIIALVLWACFATVPPRDANYSLVTFGHIRGSYNGAWIGLMFGLVYVTLFPLVAFYLVRGAINRDRSARLGPILAASALTRWQYLSGKLLSNAALLAAILVVISIGGIAMLWLRGTTSSFDLIQFVAPLWLMALPVMVIVAGLAVLFETVRGLCGGFGNIVYFFLWAFALSLLFGHPMRPSNHRAWITDPLGIGRPITLAQRYVAEQAPSYKGELSVGFGDPEDSALRIIPWPDYPWSGRGVAERAAWLAVGSLLVLPAGLFFDRFDPARGRTPRLRARLRGPPPLIAAGTPTAVSAADLPAIKLHGTSPLRFAAAEAKLMLRGQSLWWWAVLAGFFLASILTPLAIARAWILPLLWLWPVLVFSPLGARDWLAGVTPLLTSSALYGWRLVIAGWLAGAAFALLFALGVIARVLLASEPAVAGALVVGAMFIPALALALGNLTRGTRLFEVTYLGLWYAATQNAAVVDFMARRSASIAHHQSPIFLGATLTLLILAVAARRWPIRR